MNEPRIQKLPYGQSIIGFDSLESIEQYLDESERAAIMAALDEQWQIDWGSYVFRMVDDLAIWGYVLSQDEFLALSPDEGQYEETLAELEQLRVSFARGYRYGQWFSEVEPTGEWGSAHVSTLWSISQEDFEHAQGQEWLVWPEFAAQLLAQMRVAKDKRDQKEEGR